ncbi:MAG: MFS transporter [Pyrodictiaceae archaeon]
MANRVALVLSLSVFLFFAATMGLGSIITRYADYLGAGATEAGAVYSVASLISASLRIPIGMLADRFGSVPFMVLGLAFSGIAGLAAAMSTSVAHLYLVRGIQGLGIASYIAPSIAVASLLAKDVRDTARILSYRSASISLALIASPPIAAWLVDNISFQAAFLYVLAVSLVGIPVTLILLRWTPRSRLVAAGSKAWRKALRRDVVKRNVAIVVALAFLDGSVFISLQAIPQYEVAEIGLPATVYGMFLTLYGVASFSARISSYRVMDSIGPINTMILGIGFELSGVSLLSIVHGSRLLHLFYISGILYGLGLGLLVPSEQYVLLLGVSRETRNTIASLYAVGVDVGGGVGTIAYSAIADLLGYTVAYQAMAVIELVGLLLVILGLARGAPQPSILRLPDLPS